MRISDFAAMGALSGEKDECIKALFRQASRYHLASLQDRNPAVAARHNGYAVALVSSLRDIADEAEVKRVTGKSLKELWNAVIEVQDRIEAAALALLEELKKKGFKIPDLTNVADGLGYLGQETRARSMDVARIAGTALSAIGAYLLFRAMVKEEKRNWRIVYGAIGALSALGALYGLSGVFE